MTPNSSEKLTVDQWALHNFPEYLNFQNSLYLLLNSYDTHLSTLHETIQTTLMLKQVVHIFTIWPEKLLPLVLPFL